MADSEQIIRQLSDELADMRRRLAALETAPRANMTSVRNGYTRWFVGDTAEFPRVHIGVDDEGNDIGFWVTGGTSGQGYYGTTAEGAGVVLSLFSEDSTFGVLNLENGGVRADASLDEVNFRVSPRLANGDLISIISNEMYAPLIATAWQRDPFNVVDGLGNPVTASGSHTVLHRTWLPITADTVSTQLYIGVGGGVTSAEVRIRGRIANSSDAYQVVATYSGLTVSGFLSSPIWAVPTAISSNGVVIGRMCEFIAEARVTGGAGNVSMGAWAPLANWPS